MEGFQAGAESGHDHFFKTFGKFGAATADKGEMLAAVAQINVRQHVHYLETLVSRQSSAVRDLAAKVGFNDDFAAMRAQLLAGGMAQIVAAAIAETDADMTRFRTLLNCASPAQADPACAMSTRFDYQVGRATDPEIVFTNLLLGFLLQTSDTRYVGVNLVQPEDDPVALRDYTLQMRMIRYLRSVYPDAHVTLHAGEIVPGLVPAADLRSHIREAVEIAGAERIGHGVDVLGETNAAGLLATMARRKVLVEVPLTSNRQILGVFGNDAPVHALSRGRRPGCAGDRRPCRLAHRPDARVRVRDRRVRARIPHAQAPVADVAGVLVPAGQEPLAGARRPSRACCVRLGHDRRAAAEPRLPRAAAGQHEGRDAVAPGARDPRCSSAAAR